MGLSAFIAEKNAVPITRMCAIVPRPAARQHGTHDTTEDIKTKSLGVS